MGRSLYDILGIKKDADPEEIKKAYRKQANKYHPDKNQGKDTTDIFQKISEAHTILSDPSARKNYDEFGSTDNRDVKDIFIQVVQSHMTYLVNLDTTPADSVNLIAELKRTTEEEIAGFKAQITDLTKKKKNAEKIRKRIIYKGAGKNVFTDALDINIADFEIKINNANNSIKQRTEFVEFLGEYDYEKANGGFAFY